MKNNNIFYMQLAYKSSLISFLNNNIPVGAVITDKNEKIYAYNNISLEKKDVFEHAEIKCLKKINNLNCKKNDICIFSTLISCPACSGNIYMNNIKNIYFGCENNDEKYNEICYMMLKKKIKGFYLEKRCSFILNSFFKVKRKLFPGK